MPWSQMPSIVITDDGVERVIWGEETISLISIQKDTRKTVH